MMPSGYESPVYMEPRILSYLRAWPEVGSGTVDIEVLLRDAGVLVECEDLPEGELKLSRFGERVRALCRTQTYNFWLVPAFLDLLPLEHLAGRTSPASAFMRVLQLDWNSRDVRTYISARMREQDRTIAVIRQPARDLRSMLDALGEAFDRLSGALDRK